MASYRAAERLDPDPVTEADVIVELMHRTTALRRRLLVLTVGASVVGGAAGVAVYGSVTALYGRLPAEIYARICGACFAAFAILTFRVARLLSVAIARGRERRWIAELAAQHQLDPRPLAEALGLFA
jgi:hypothetical protein